MTWFYAGIGVMIMIFPSEKHAPRQPPDISGDCAHFRFAKRWCLAGLALALGLG